MHGPHLVKHWSKTQTTVLLSSGEAELHGIAAGVAQALGLQALAKDLGWQLKIGVHTDATAAIGIARRRGLGKIRHLDCSDLWIQERIRAGDVELRKVLGTDKPADALTKYLARPDMTAALKRMGLVVMDGRPACAPVAKGA